MVHAQDVQSRIVKTIAYDYALRAHELQGI